MTLRIQGIHNKLFCQLKQPAISCCHTELLGAEGRHKLYFVVPENIHSHPKDGHWEPHGGGDLESQNV